MRLFFLLTVACFSNAADWLSSSADPKHTRSQPAETELSRETIRDLKLLWKLHFDEPITAPVVLGPIYTHRGIKELVFFGGEGDNLYAVDADLARIVWKRHFENANPGKLTAAPVLGSLITERLRMVMTLPHRAVLCSCSPAMEGFTPCGPPTVTICPRP